MFGSSQTEQLLSSIATSLQESVSSVLTSNDTLTNNTVNVQQSMTIVIGPTGSIDCDTISNLQTVHVNLNYMTNINNNVATNVVKKLNSDLTNETTQISNIIRGFLSNIGTSSNDQITTDVITRLTQIVDSTVTTQNINRSINASISIQKNKLIINGTMKGRICNLNNQNAQLDLVANNIVDDITQTALNDEVLGKLMNQVSQTLTKQEQGLESLFAPLMYIIIALIIGAVLFFTVFSKRITDPKFLKAFIIIIIFMIILYFILAYFFKWAPFKKPREYWGCEKNPDSTNTGKCIKYDNIQDGPFPSIDACASADRCTQFWGCEKTDDQQFYTGKCKQYTSIVDGQYNSQEECNANASVSCANKYGCTTDSSGFNVSPATCSEYAINDISIPSKTYISQQSCSDNIGKCVQYWYCNFGKCVQSADPDTIDPTMSEIYNTESECSVNCKY